MKVLVPCAGKSSRFPGVRPKWMLTHPNGDLMVTQAIDGLNGVEKEDIIITILREHEEKYDISKGLKENIGEEIEIVILDEPTKSQSETVYETLKRAKVDEPFLVKDSDNYFSVDVDSDSNYICYSNLDEFDEINATNKSYIKMNEQGVIVDMVEKKIISTTFNVGGYFFKNVDNFFETYDKLNDNRDDSDGELYLSHVVEDMIVNQDEVFLGKKVENYIDWGTLDEWTKYKNKFRTFFLDVDGVLFENAAQHFKPRWENSDPLEDNAKFIKELSDDPYTQIFFVTARPEEYRSFLEDKLDELGIDFSGILMGCLHGKRIMVNDFSKTNGYPSCEAVSVPRDVENLRDYIV